ncbi:MAG: hypothetical protein PHV77_02195 [Candidatus Omnitrophica bacterium]|nr:hypothetical protein [Candidatus Omnitrophota bacterium]
MQLLVIQSGSIRFLASLGMTGVLCLSSRAEPARQESLAKDLGVTHVSSRAEPARQESLAKDLGVK